VFKLSSAGLIFRLVLQRKAAGVQHGSDDSITRTVEVFVRHLHCHIYHTMAQSLLLVVAHLERLNVSV